ncbi:hypothetical protein PEDI_37560 [Persicobacter diffluens]|uniref:Uncharacterized protein n=1 Tax=Persicobacter diffluens TaxID=981 RepID=A0AAN5ALF9_9BACT|nr:hypothetical protein PEDI_37560 [Persicobacter diffluens]
MISLSGLVNALSGRKDEPFSLFLGIKDIILRPAIIYLPFFFGGLLPLRRQHRARAAHLIGLLGRCGSNRPASSLPQAGSRPRRSPRLTGRGIAPLRSSFSQPKSVAAREKSDWQKPDRRQEGCPKNKKRQPINRCLSNNISDRLTKMLSGPGLVFAFYLSY